MAPALKLVPPSPPSGHSEPPLGPNNQPIPWDPPFECIVSTYRTIHRGELQLHLTVRGTSGYIREVDCLVLTDRQTNAERREFVRACLEKWDAYQPLTIWPTSNETLERVCQGELGYTGDVGEPKRLTIFSMDDWSFIFDDPPVTLTEVSTEP